MRARFEVNKHETDPRKASILLADGCRQLWKKRHPLPVSFPDDPFGSNYNRNKYVSDVMIDKLLYVEREEFPYYFNRREERKKELLEHWAKVEKAWDDEISAIQTRLPEEKVAEKQVDS